MHIQQMAGTLKECDRMFPLTGKFSIFTSFVLEIHLNLYIFYTFIIICPLKIFKYATIIDSGFLCNVT